MYISEEFINQLEEFTVPPRVASIAGNVLNRANTLGKNFKKNTINAASKVTGQVGTMGMKASPEKEWAKKQMQINAKTKIEKTLSDVNLKKAKEIARVRNLAQSPEARKNAIVNIKNRFQTTANSIKKKLQPAQLAGSPQTSNATAPSSPGALG